MDEVGAVAVVVDTYALMAMAFGELTSRAEEVMLDIRNGRRKGLLPSTVAYEFALQWLRGRLPLLRSMDEVRGFLIAYFEVVDLSLDDLLEVAKVKNRGDALLRDSGTERRLSLTDASIIWLARRMKAPIVSGDRDLSCVASKLGLEIIW